MLSAKPNSIFTPPPEELGDAYDGPPRLADGLVEMQRWFMKLARKQGLLPASAVREDSAPYGAPPPEETD